MLSTYVHICNTASLPSLWQIQFWSTESTERRRDNRERKGRLEAAGIRKSTVMFTEWRKAPRYWKCGDVTEKKVVNTVKHPVWSYRILHFSFVLFPCAFLQWHFLWSFPAQCAFPFCHFLYYSLHGSMSFLFSCSVVGNDMKSGYYNVK